VCDWEIEDHDLVTAEKASLQKGMNYGVGKNYSMFLISPCENAPYADALDGVTGMLIPQPRETSRRTAASGWTESEGSSTINDAKRELFI
jgi:hypothetical protein